MAGIGGRTEAATVRRPSSVKSRHVGGSIDCPDPDPGRNLHPSAVYPETFSFSSLPTLKKGSFFAFTAIDSPVFGFLPV